MYGRSRSSPRPSPSSSARLRSLTCESTPATSSHGTRTRPPPPSQAAIRPITPARARQTPGPQRIATTSKSPPGAALYLDVIDLAAATPLRVDQVVVEDAVSDVELVFSHFSASSRVGCKEQKRHGGDGDDQDHHEVEPDREAIDMGPFAYCPM